MNGRFIGGPGGRRAQPLEMHSVNSTAGAGAGGLASVIAREREAALQTSRGDLYIGATRSLTLRARLVAGPACHPELDAVLDAARPAGKQGRAAALQVAASVRDATVFAAIRLPREAAADTPPPISVYRVQAKPFHTGPRAVIEELSRRIREGRPFEALAREYWTPTGIWHLREVLVPSLVVIEEVPPASEREIYVLRWVLLRKDDDRAQSL
jgi:hypothetical protein